MIEALVGNQAYKLALPDNYNNMHNVFHVSLLEPAHLNMIPGQVQKEPPPIVLKEDGAQWQAETLLDSKCSRRHLYYLVRWKDFSIDKDSWVPAEDIAEDLKKDFHHQYPAHPGGPEAEGATKYQR